MMKMNRNEQAHRTPSLATKKAALKVFFMDLGGFSSHQASELADACLPKNRLSLANKLFAIGVESDGWTIKSIEGAGHISVTAVEAAIKKAGHLYNI